ncbi:MAG TPA: sulfotransferase [Bacteroidia bacterium]|nr:sulfotransferase [Bacteroidia bacterium]HNT80730.1 sulfotransferase [Bacteroidia bacterium]
MEKKKIFVLGNSRSGTTMMGRMLNKHSEVFTFGELHFFGPMWSKQTSEKKLSEVDAELLAEKLLARQRQGFLIFKLNGAEKQEAKEIVASIPANERTAIEVYKKFLEFETQRHSKTHSCEQTPPNIFYINEIIDHVPNAYVINMVRDSRDVLLSQKRKWKRKFLGAGKIPLMESLRAYLNYHPITISKLWNSAVQTGRRFETHPKVKNVKFEDVINDPEKTLRDICSFLKLEYQSQMIQVPRVGSSSSFDESSQIGTSKSVLGQWQKGGLNKAEIEICERECKSNLQHFGYAISNTKANFIQRWFYYGSFPVKLGFAFLFNLRRMKNIRQTIQKRFGI